MITAVRNAIVGAVTLTAALIGQAQAYTVFGPGNFSCGEFLQAADGERKARPRDATPDGTYTAGYLSFESYAQGFLSGINWARQYNSSDAHVGSSMHDYFTAAMTEIENYCHQHPLDIYLRALISLRNTLETKEQQ
jgi:hypothetical protein